MKPISALALLSLAASFAVTGAVAQNAALKAQIPFAFTAGNSNLPADSYTISSPSSGVVRLVGKHGEYTMITSSRSNAESEKGQNALVFDKVGEQYFLRHILCPSTAQMNQDIPAWKAERNARERNARERNALLQTGEPVLVMATLSR